MGGGISNPLVSDPGVLQCVVLSHCLLAVCISGLSTTSFFYIFQCTDTVALCRTVPINWASVYAKSMQWNIIQYNAGWTFDHCKPRNDPPCNNKLNSWNYRFTFLPVVIYGWERGPWPAEDNRSVKVFDRHCMKAILKINWSGRMSKTTFFVCVRRLWLQWFYHVPWLLEWKQAKQTSYHALSDVCHCRFCRQLKTHLGSVLVLDIHGIGDSP